MTSDPPAAGAADRERLGQPAPHERGAARRRRTTARCSISTASSTSGRTRSTEVPDVLAQARDLGMTLAFVTNNAARTPADVGRHLRELGVEARAEDVVTSAQAAAARSPNGCRPGAKVLVVGGEGLERPCKEHDLVPVELGRRRPGRRGAGLPPAPWAGRCSPRAPTRSARALPWIASNLDLTVPTARGIAPGNGALVEAVATAVGREPDVVAGKPYRPLFDETVRRIASRAPARDRRSARHRHRGRRDGAAPTRCW